MDNEQMMQERAFKIQLLEQQIVQVQKQLQQLENQLIELDITKDSLDELKKSKKGDEMLSMISPGIFVKTNLSDNRDIIINAGANIAVKKKTNEVKEMLDEQTEEIKGIHAQLMIDMQKLSGAMARLEEEG